MAARDAADVNNREAAICWDGAVWALPEQPLRVDWRKSDAFYLGLGPFDHPVWLCERGYGASRTPAARYCSSRSGHDRLRPRFGSCLRPTRAADPLPVGTVQWVQWTVYGSFPGLRAWRIQSISRQCETRWL